MLTRKQQTLLQFIHERMQQEGVPPSFEEMKEALDLKSKSGIHRLITALEERGFIRRLPNRARALEVIKTPDAWASGADEPVTVTKPGESGSIIHANFGAGGPSRELENRGDNVHKFPGAGETREEEAFGFSVPVMGRIAAGVPISAIQDNTHSVTVPPEMIRGGDYFALEVQGDSMVEAGIHEGDMVVIKQTASADAGDIVVALVDDEEATLKTFRRKGTDIALEAANPAYETRILSGDRVKVQGRLVGLIRQYH